MKRSFVAVPVVLVLAVVAVAAYLLGGARPPTAAVAATTTASNDGVVVDGTGKTVGVPDVLRLTLGVSGSGGDVTSALNTVNAQIARVRAQLRKDGADGNDIQTADVNIYPTYSKKGRRYQVSEQLTAKLHNLKTAGRAISNAVAVGGPGLSLQGVSFSLEDNEALLNKARDEAFADAKQKAERYAHLSGASLGKVSLVTESVLSPPVAYDKQVFRGALTAATDASVPLYAGTSDISVSVTVRWALS